MRHELALEDTKSVALMHERPELCSPAVEHPLHGGLTFRQASLSRAGEPRLCLLDLGHMNCADVSLLMCGNSLRSRKIAC